MSDVVEKAPEAAPAAKPEQMVIDTKNVSPEQRVAILRHVHTFFATFDRVPGSLASQWGNALDALAVVANALTAELPKK